MAALLCNTISSLFSSTCSNPFGYLILPTAIVTNLPPIIVGLQSLSTAATCKGSLYCTIALLFAACHISASAYISITISNRQSRRLASQTTYTRRLGWLLCQDGWVASYLVIFVLYVLWLWVGIGWRLDDEVHDAGHHGYDHNACPRHVGTWVDSTVAWGFVFLTALVWMLIVSFCVGCCCDTGRDYSYVDIQHDEEDQRIISGGGQQGKQTYGAVASAAAVAVPAPSAPPYDPKIPVATATPIGKKNEM